MAIIIDQEKCTREQKCQAMLVCPMGAIERDAEGFTQVNQGLCTRCRKCFVYCKNRAIREE